MAGRGACRACCEGGREELEECLTGAGEPERDLDGVFRSFNRCVLSICSNCSERTVGLNGSCCDLRGGGGGGALRGGPLKSPIAVHSTLFTSSISTSQCDV